MDGAGQAAGHGRDGVGVATEVDGEADRLGEPCSCADRPQGGGESRPHRSVGLSRLGTPPWVEDVGPGIATLVGHAGQRVRQGGIGVLPGQGDGDQIAVDRAAVGGGRSPASR